MVANDEPVETKPLNDIKQRKKKEEIDSITDFKNTEKDKLDAIDFNTDSSWELMLFPVFNHEKLKY
jgi:hypothetical protein